MPATEEKDNRAFSTRHLWARFDEEKGIAYIGITEFLAEQLAEIESIDMPGPDDEIDMDSMCIHLYLTKRIHHLRSPLSGRVVECNKEVLDNCSLLHLDPNKYWLFSMEYDNEEELDLLMDAQQYADYIDKL